MRGPSTLAELAEATALEHDALVVALAHLQTEGFALRGRFDPDAVEDQYCARRLLGRIHAYTQERLRREIEPVSAQDFMRFLLRYQHVDPAQRLTGTRGLLQVIAAAGLRGRRRRVGATCAARAHRALQARVAGCAVPVGAGHLGHG